MPRLALAAQFEEAVAARPKNSRKETRPTRHHRRLARRVLSLAIKRFILLEIEGVNQSGELAFGKFTGAMPISRNLPQG
jgi:hypothetical protein